MNLVPSFLFKQDTNRKQLKKIQLYTDDLSKKSLKNGIQLFHKRQKQKKQEQFLKAIMKLMDQKTTYCRKLKLLTLLVEISKQTKYDIADILSNKKLKIFINSSSKLTLLPILTKESIQKHIYLNLLVPLYNYLMKLSINEELYNTCLSRQIPNDQVFRRGTKIRFIWIFKIYNLIHLLIPILDSLNNFLKTFPNFQFLQECAQFLYNDMVMMNNFIVKAIQQASEDNYMLMPYFDMLQFYQSLTQQIQTIKRLKKIYSQLSRCVKNLQMPSQIKLTEQQISQIQIQALRVKLISNSLKNPKKDHTRLQTQYNQKSQLKTRNRGVINTQGNICQEIQDDIQAFKEKYKNLDIKRNSLDEISDKEQESDDDSNMGQMKQSYNSKRL